MYLHLGVLGWLFIACLAVAAVLCALDGILKLSKPLRTRSATLLGHRIWALAPLALVVIALGVLAAGLLGGRYGGLPGWRYPYEPERIVGKKFSNERVVLDGRSFFDCEFSNVTLVYNGTTPIQLRGNRLRGVIRYDSDNPAVVATILMLNAMREFRPDFKLDLPAARTEAATRGERAR
jgi:hypothetical protein